MKRSIDIVTLGCSKNLVDSERLIAQLETVGYQVHIDPDEPTGDIAIVNTCGFIADAQEESINTILQLAQRKSEGRLQKLYVMGCLSQRFLDDLKQEIPEVDRFYGKFNWMEILDELGKTYRDDLRFHRKITTPGHYAYLKISEGCDRTCSYCAIPIITGHHVSRPVEEILDETRWLVSQGVKEFQIIAQELTYYGLDLYHKRCIADLVEQIAQVKGVEWIRLHYAYPADFPKELLRVMREHDNVCKYLDVALQHIADPVLKAMRRNITSEETYQFIENIRHEVPNIHLRTTLMVGHPGETEEGFRQLMDFVEKVRFERMGAFAYSEEMGTYSANHFRDDIPEEVKQTRLSRLMRLQQRISAEIQEAKVGETHRVIIDRTEGEYYVGRTQYDSPEVDPEVLIKISDNPALETGRFYSCKITSADDFDLYGEIGADSM